MKEIPVQKLADELGLSRVTVWKAMNDKPGVSPRTKSRILDAANRYQNGQLSLRTSEFLPTDEKTFRQVTLLLSRASSSSFWMRMLNQIAHELNRSKINLHYAPIDDLNDRMPNLEALVQADRSQGIIIVNVYNRDLIDKLSRLDLPKVYFDTLPEYNVMDLSGDLFLLDGRGPIEAITSNFIRNGCKRIGFIGDIHYAKTNHLRWEGFINALDKNKLALDRSICYTGPIPAEYYTESIGSFLDNLDDLPDAFVCASDFVTFNVLNHLSKKGVRVPEDIQLSGYDKSTDFLLTNHDIATVQVQNEQLGKRLIHQLSYRVSNPHADFEEITITPQILTIK